MGILFFRSSNVSCCCCSRRRSVGHLGSAVCRSSVKIGLLFWLVAAAEVVFLLSFLKSQSVFLSRNGLVLAFSSHLGGGNLQHLSAAFSRLLGALHCTLAEFMEEKCSRWLLAPPLSGREGGQTLRIKHNTSFINLSSFLPTFLTP
jgi:hypothetical protein